MKIFDNVCKGSLRCTRLLPFCACSSSSSSSWHPFSRVDFVSFLFSRRAEQRHHPKKEPQLRDLTFFKSPWWCFVTRHGKLWQLWKLWNVQQKVSYEKKLTKNLQKTCVTDNRSKRSQYGSVNGQFVHKTSHAFETLLSFLNHRCKHLCKVGLLIVLYCRQAKIFPWTLPTVRAREW